ncbi:hypothetical protein [Marispirochaeta sp.]|jgi:hypothetical protein|uniref:hypothetical protein n=1 Tax=Marispirochaeta sp. TaxID=2038653 RepID=UPI0029C60484|nr:hypothetical protein [Marispirochaeta sp.]
MEVIVNSSPIDVRLEEEKNAYEVIRQLDTWLVAEGFFITGILVNGHAETMTDSDALKNFSVESIEKLEVLAQPLNELSLERYSTLLQYFSYLYRALHDGDMKLLKDLRDESGPIIENMDSILKLRVGDRLVSEVFSELVSNLKLDDDFPRIPEGLKDFAGNLCIFIEGRIREIANPLMELRSTASLLEAYIPKLEDIPILLQTGKEKEAMEMVIAFSEISEKLTRLYPQLKERDGEDLMTREIDGVTFEEFYIDLNTKFLELTEAMEAEDSILIGDLLEYEIAPKIRELTKSIENLPAFADRSL